MARKCGLVVYVRPCRTKPRNFTPCDVARIAWYAAVNHSRQDIIATAGYRLGFFSLLDASELTEGEIRKRAEDFWEMRGRAKTVAKITSFTVLGILLRFIAPVVLQIAKFVLVELTPFLVLEIIEDARLVKFSNCKSR